MIHIQRFIERVQGQDARGSKDLVMSMKDAKDLHADITKLLLSMEQLRSHSQPKEEPTDQAITVEVTGGSF